jgi:hypothetical protein
MHAYVLAGKNNYPHVNMPNQNSRPEPFTSSSFLPPIFDSFVHSHLLNQFAFFSFNFKRSYLFNRSSIFSIFCVLVIVALNLVLYSVLVMLFSICSVLCS